MKIIPPEILAYCAGVIDADGTIRVARNKAPSGIWRYHEYVRVKQVEREAVDLLVKTFGGFVHKEIAAGRRDMISWTVCSKQGHACLTALLPYLRIKHRQAVNALLLRSVIIASKSVRLVGGRRMARPRLLSRKMEAIHATAAKLNGGVV
jgi:hypothetical protein